jgi:hypothetical protein
MNWDAIAAVAELSAALAVIFSFIYLARQIRQSTHTQRRSNVQDIAAGSTNILMSAVADPELASLVLRAHVNLSSLDPVERYRFDGFLYAWLSSFERALIDGRDGEYPEEYLIPMRAAIAGFLRTEGGRSWWEERQIWFSPYGQRIISSIVEDRTIDHRNAGPRLEA